MSNLLKGRNSYDSTSTGALIPFLNRNVTPYATEAGSPKFDLIPVTKQKDLMINHARMYAQQEYDRIMELVAVLEKQAQQITRRIEVTDAVHGAVYQFQAVMGNAYWLVWDKKENRIYLQGKENKAILDIPYDLLDEYAVDKLMYGVGALLSLNLIHDYK